MQPAQRLVQWLALHCTVRLAVIVAAVRWPFGPEGELMPAKLAVPVGSICATGVSGLWHLAECRE